MKKLHRKAIGVGCMAILATMSLSAAPVIADTIDGGWSENTGIISAQFNQAPKKAAAKGTASHTGKAEEKVIKGTTNKRSHGWTTWTGVRHYTTARLEHYGIFGCNGGTIASKKVWGTNGTEAATRWVPYQPNACCSGTGRARTYYGH